MTANTRSRWRSPCRHRTGRHRTGQHSTDQQVQQEVVIMSAVTGSLEQVRDWILRKHPERESVEADLDLIENRLIDSLSFVEFVFTIESASGVSIDVETIDVDDFRTLSAIE